MTFRAKIIKFPINKTYTCKGHELVSGSGIFLILENEERIFIPNKYIVKFDSNWFKMIEERIKNESKNNIAN